MLPTMMRSPIMEPNFITLRYWLIPKNRTEHYHLSIAAERAPCDDSRMKANNGTPPALTGGFSILSAISSRLNRNRRDQAMAVDTEPWHELRDAEYFCKKDDRPLTARTGIALDASSEATCYYCVSCRRGVILSPPQRQLEIAS